MSFKKLWMAFAIVVIASFAVLLYYGAEIYRQAPPIPEKVVTSSGETIFTREDIQNGQNVWQSIGGQEVGSIWGHGAYVAPDWTADWLHREGMFIVGKWATQEFSKPYENLNEEQQAVLISRLKKEVRTNTYSETDKTLTVSPLRKEAIEAMSTHYRGVFMDEPSLASLREAYAIPANTIRDTERMRQMNAFFFWASWAAGTERPGQAITYTNNWPPDKLIGNEPTGSLLLWTGFSVIILLAGIGVLTLYYVSQKNEEADVSLLPETDPLLGLNPTPSMRATLKYFWVVTALIVVQVILGAVAAHYAVEGNGFYGLALSDLLPYSVTRTWHVQLGIFWIATSWLATGLFMGPAVSEHEPKFQRFGVNFLFFALLIIVVGSMAGQWVGIMQKLDFVQNFWFGHQGYEYVDLGRFWQSFLLVGLFLWLFLMVRSIWPAFKKVQEAKHLLALFLISCAAIAIFYGAGLMWGRHTNLAVAEYWRWWVVHLWVEGFFEVFATVVIAFLFV
ncbi:MAG: cbb3-type cytochrome c oxidase subunit I, partial [Bdellovibrio sp.]